MENPTETQALRKWSKHFVKVRESYIRQGWLLWVFSNVESFFAPDFGYLHQIFPEFLRVCLVPRMDWFIR